MQLSLRLPNDSELRERILGGLPSPAPFLIVEPDANSADIAIGVSAEEVEACLYIDLVGADRHASFLAPNRFAVDRAAPASVWRVTVMLALEVARLRRRSTESDRQAAEYLEQAQRDALTGLSNRRGWDQRIQDWQSQHTGASVGCLILDVDDFKGCNDQYGHPFGDQVLKAIAEALPANLRQHDHVARIGGDEFAAWLPGLTFDKGLASVERLRRQVACELSNRFGERAPTLSIGVATGEETADTLLERADRALYLAKQRGRDQSRILPQNSQ